MHKWQQKQRQKKHDSIIENAKSTFQRLPKSRQKYLTTSRSKVNIKNYDNIKPTIPFVKILEIFNLQQYANLLLFYGFPQKLKYNGSLDDIDQMLSKVDKNDKERFMSLLNTLSLMSKNLNKKQSSIDIKRTSLLSRSQKSYLPPTSNKTSTSKASQTIKKRQKLLLKQPQKPSKFRVRNQIHPQLHHDSLQKKSTLKKKQKVIKHITQSKRISGVAADDFCFTHEYKNHHRGKPKLLQQSNTIIKHLYSKMKQKQVQSHPTSSNPQVLDLQLKQIKQMYLSFDSATLTSNIINIDIQQIIDCLALQVDNMIIKGLVLNKSIFNQKKIEVQQLLKQSFLEVKQEEEKQSPNKNSSTSLLKKTREIYIRENLENAQNEDNSHSSTISVLQRSFESKCSEQSINNPLIYDSLICDFLAFNCRLDDSIFVHKPTKQDIKNFIQLIMMAGKMQKQIPIIANVYMKKLLKYSKGHLTYQNWRNIVLICLIEGSKIWDDQSLQNHSFSKVIKPYTTLQINRLEKHLLAYIDYSLTIDQRQYSKSYFQLRKHAKQAAKTANLVKLDLNTIKKLQSGAKKSEGKLKDYYSKCLNKSF